jgi:DNA polymerase-1
MTPTFLGKALFNEPITITQEEAHLRVLKNGQPAKRKRKIDIEYKPKQVAWMDSSLKEIGGNGQIKVPAELLATASMSLGDEHFSKAVLDYRSAEKLLNTYLDPIRDFRTKAESECVHPQFNLTSTNTGRTSCAKPNAQNLPPEVEKMITGGTYKIVKADFKQLQIVGLALVTKDAQLIDDLQNGRDIHYETGKTVFNWTDPNQMNKADRRVVKNTNFGLIFGGSAGGIARQTGVDKKTVAQCINAFYSRYPGVKEWHDKIKDEALEKATPIPEEFNECGDQVRETYLRTPLGRLLRFEERDAPAWLKARTKRSIAFSPNEIVCYPIQGYTDGDLVPAFIVECNDYVGNSWFIPINMVHDSLWLLTTDPERTKVELNKAVERLNTSLGLKVPLALDITVEG